MPLYITLAHELIHADRAMRGVAISLEEIVSNMYISGERIRYFLFIPLGKENIIHIEMNIRKEELATMGINYMNTNDITENMIRKEQGLNQRTTYGGPYFGGSAPYKGELY